MACAHPNNWIETLTNNNCTYIFKRYCLYFEKKLQWKCSYCLVLCWHFWSIFYKCLKVVEVVLENVLLHTECVTEASSSPVNQRPDTTCALKICRGPSPCVQRPSGSSEQLKSRRVKPGVVCFLVGVYTILFFSLQLFCARKAENLMHRLCM